MQLSTVPTVGRIWRKIFLKIKTNVLMVVKRNGIRRNNEIKSLPDGNVLWNA